MSAKSRERLYGPTLRATKEQTRDARRKADTPACVEWNQRMLGFRGQAQPSPMLGDALNAGYLYLEVGCLGFQTYQTVNLTTLRMPKATTPTHERER